MSRELVSVPARRAQGKTKHSTNYQAGEVQFVPLFTPDPCVRCPESPTHCILNIYSPHFGIKISESQSVHGRTVFGHVSESRQWTGQPFWSWSWIPKVRGNISGSRVLLVSSWCPGVFVVVCWWSWYSWDLRWHNTRRVLVGLSRDLNI